MNLQRCAVQVNFSDGLQNLSLEAIDVEDAYRLVFRWGHSLQAPDQGLVPTLYTDMPKEVFQAMPDGGDGVTLLCNQPIDLDATFASVLGEEA